MEGAASAPAVSDDLPVSVAMWEWSCHRETYLASLKQHIPYLSYTRAAGEAAGSVVRMLQTRHQCISLCVEFHLILVLLMPSGAVCTLTVQLFM